MSRVDVLYFLLNLIFRVFFKRVRSARHSTVQFLLLLTQRVGRSTSTCISYWYRNKLCLAFFFVAFRSNIFVLST